MNININADLMIQLLESKHISDDERQKVKKLLFRTIKLSERLIDYAEKNMLENE